MSLFETHYQAPKPLKPKMTGKQIAWTIAYWLFPPTLLWEIAKFLVNFSLGHLVGLILLPTWLHPDDIKIKIANHHCHVIQEGDDKTIILDNFAIPSGLAFHEHKVTTHDGACSEGCTILNTKHSGKPLGEQKFIIMIEGSGQIYENHLQEMFKTAEGLECHVIGFNFRRAKNIMGHASSANQPIIDGIAQVQRLLDAGVKADNIILSGYSMGGDWATLTAKHFHDLNLPVYLFTDRPFSSLTHVAVGWLRTLGRSGHKEVFLGKLLAWLAWPVIKAVLVLTQWDIDITDAYKSLPESHKDYLVVRSNKLLRTSVGNRLIDDVTITHFASLHQAVKVKTPKQQQDKKRFKKQLAALLAAEGKRTPQQETALANTSRQLERLKAASNRHKFMAAFDTNGHNVPLTSLRNRLDGISGDAFLQNFVNRKSLS